MKGRWMKQRVAIMFVTAVVTVVASSASFGDDDLPSLDELLEIEPPPQDIPTLPTPHHGQDDPSSPREMKIEWPEGADQDGQEPSGAFGQAIVQMHKAAGRLEDQRDTGIETQRIQETVLAALDQAIAEAKRRGSGSSSKGGGGGSTQADQQETGSTTNTGQRMTGGPPSSAQGVGAGGGGGGSSSSGNPSAQQEGGLLESHRAEWGHLPPRLRDELLQGINERFSSVYKQLTERYYQRLAEEGR